MRMKRRAFLVCVAGAAIVVGVIVIGGIVQKRMVDNRIDAEVVQISAMIDLPKPHSEAFDAVRVFLQSHSEHNTADPEFAELREGRQFTTAILAHARGDRELLVPMECASRSNVMGAVLRRIGYKTRRIAIFDTDTNGLRSHTFLEVLNPDTGRWETQDPDYGIFWRDKATGARASLYDKAEVFEDEIEPCNGERCGWDRKSEGLRRYIDILTLADKQAGTKSSIYTSRAKPDGPFQIKGKSGAFCDVMAKRCADGFAPAL